VFRLPLYGFCNMGDEKESSPELFPEYEQLRKLAYDEVGTLTAKQLRKLLSVYETEKQQHQNAARTEA
jgi:hypothetical protein